MTWMQTFSGKVFYPLAPDPKLIDLGDIAHALSMQCRFAGHVKWHYCPTPEQIVLTAELSWKPAGDLSRGEQLLAFDEAPVELGAAGNRRRRFRLGTVTELTWVRRRVIRLEMEDGSTCRSSGETPWLVATKASRNQKWLSAREIAVDVQDGRKRYMHKFMDPWPCASGSDVGWLAGIYDGEGHLSMSRRGISMGIGQNPGIVLDRAMDVHRKLGFERWCETNVSKSSDVVCLRVSGGWRQAFRLLGTIRPVRLLAALKEHLRSGEFSKQMDGLGPPLRVVRAWDEGTGWCVGLETSTRTYLCEGFGAHNSVAQHAVLVSKHVRPENAAWGLLHDAMEAYLVDLPRPVKDVMLDYQEAEARLQLAVAERFGLSWPMPDEVERADREALATEYRDLMGPGEREWESLRGIHPWPERIERWTQDHAKATFLAVAKGLKIQ